MSFTSDEYLYELYVLNMIPDPVLQNPFGQIII